MKKLVLLFALLSMVSPVAWSLDVAEFRAQSIDVSRGKAVLYSHESALLGLSCKSGPIGEVTNRSTISLGDEIRVGKYEFRVGLIQVTRFNEDLRGPGTEVIARRGDLVCVLAANERALPSKDDCDAIWVRVTNCLPLR